MKMIYESDELKITKGDNEFRVLDKISDHWFRFRLDFFDCFYNDRRKEINQWDFCKQYPTVVPILVDLGELEKWENGFKIEAVDRVRYYDMQMIHKIVEYSGGGTYYSRYDNLHRTDGPAIEYASGDKQWYIDGKYHRTDGPAIERVSGEKEWYINGKRHRTDGPAVEYANGGKQWWINDNKINDNKITEDVEQWVAENNYTVPFGKSAQAQFILKFAGG